MKCGKNTQKSPEQKEAGRVLEKARRDGAREMLLEAVHVEVDEFIESHKQMRDESGKRLVGRNGYLPSRKILAGLGPLRLRQPRVDDRARAGRYSQARYCPDI